MPFPAVGPLGLTLARGMSWVFRLVPSQPATMRSAVGRRSTALPAQHGSPLYELNVQPIVDIVGGLDSGLERAAIQSLALKPSPAGVELLRNLLGGADPDLRNAAALALFRIEAGFERALSRATRGDDLLPPSELAGLCLQYARSGLLDTASSELYLGKACAALQQAIAKAPASADLRFQLAALKRDLGCAAEAQEILEQALNLPATNVQSCLLGMDVAFHGGRWEQLLAIARQALRIAAVDDASAELVRWWTKSEREAARST
jgi:tetratricopeptide (TPR) repeat protein